LRNKLDGIHSIDEFEYAILGGQIGAAYAFQNSLET